MANQEGDSDLERDGQSRRSVLVYLPCPACGRAVRLSDDSRVAREPETYACPNCGARFYLEEA
jgi:predicted RNA-binding Zn-ribbon protein involved in translation (DUF1610 family)